jgi:hypothetical protein
MNKQSARALEQVRAHALTCLTQLIEQVFNAGRTAAEFQEAHEALEALPLTTAAFGTARNRLLNARSYLEGGERGAALYELRLLLRALEQ